MSGVSQVRQKVDTKGYPRTGNLLAQDVIFVKDVLYEFPASLVYHEHVPLCNHFQYHSRWWSEVSVLVRAQRPGSLEE